MSRPTSVLGIELWSSGRAASNAQSWAFSTGLVESLCKQLVTFCALGGWSARTHTSMNSVSCALSLQVLRKLSVQMCLSLSDDLTDQRVLPFSMIIQCWPTCAGAASLEGGHWRVGSAVKRTCSS